MMKLSKKGQVINGLTVAISGIAGLAILLAITLYVLSTMTTSVGGNTTVAGNATQEITKALAGAPTWIAILVVVIFASAVLYFWKMNNG